MLKLINCKNFTFLVDVYNFYSELILEYSVNHLSHPDREQLLELESQR